MPKIIDFLKNLPSVQQLTASYSNSQHMLPIIHDQDYQFQQSNIWRFCSMNFVLVPPTIFQQGLEHSFHHSKVLNVFFILLFLCKHFLKFLYIALLSDHLLFLWQTDGLQFSCRIIWFKAGTMLPSMLASHPGPEASWPPQMFTLSSPVLIVCMTFLLWNQVIRNM